MAQDDDSIYVSKDGYRWVRITVPYKYRDSFWVLSTSESLVAAGPKWVFYYPLMAIDEALDDPALVIKSV